MILNNRSKIILRKKIKLLIVAFTIGYCVYIFIIQRQTTPQPSIPTSEKNIISKSDEKKIHSPTYAYSIDKPYSLWVVINKQRPIQPLEFTPEVVTPKVVLKGKPGDINMKLTKETAEALEALFENARQAGHGLMVSSAYRPYSYQVNVYNRIVAMKGQYAADQESARPGHSEHQTGLAVDIAPASKECDLHPCFAETNEGKWLSENAWRFGFILRYPDSKNSITGYSFEPWHYRYVGKELAQDMRQRDIKTMEEYFSTGPAADY